MNAQVNELMDRMRTQLNEEQGWVAADLSEPRERVVEDDAEDDDEDGGAEDAFDLFLAGILDSLLAEYDSDEEEALDFVFGLADEMAEAGKLPFIPESDDGLPEWIAAAQAAGFAQAVMDAAAESAVEADGE